MMMNKWALIAIMLCLPACQFSGGNDALQDQKPVTLEGLSANIVDGWNTWDNRSIMAPVLMPSGLSLSFQIEDTLHGGLLDKVFTGNRVKGSEQVRTLAHTPDGSYIAYTVQWHRFNWVVEMVSMGNELDILFTPETAAQNPGYLHLKPDFIYGRKGAIEWRHDQFSFETPQGPIILKASRSPVAEGKWSFDQPLAFSTREPDLSRIQQTINKAAHTWWEKRASYGSAAEAYEIIQNAINFLVVYDPVDDRAVTPVARPWSYGWGKRQEGGYVQFCWDNFFVAYMHSLENKELAYNEVMQLTRLIDTLGFVPNFAGPGHEYSRDRSQPPVGSIMVREIYRAYRETVFLEAVFEQLLKWNRWWPENRDVDGFLAWGSNAFPAQTPKQTTQHNAHAAAYESGLDNSPMFDGVPFDTVRNVMLQADVGLMSLYIADCEALADIATELGRPQEVVELRQRAAMYRGKMQKLWHEPTGLFLNKRLDTDEWSFRLSPTHFYPLLARAANQPQATRMIAEHFYNPEEFCGTYILPSAARNDTAYTGRDYWRGSIWAPMNFLTYLGLCNYDLPKPREDLAQKSMHLLQRNWASKGQVLENYDAEKGAHPGYRSEYFYHWGALMGMIQVIESGKVGNPGSPL